MKAKYLTFRTVVLELRMLIFRPEEIWCHRKLKSHSIPEYIGQHNAVYFYILSAAVSEYSSTNKEEEVCIRDDSQ